MKTVTILIGNSDDRLTQREWSDFVCMIGVAARHFSEQVHFFAPSPGTELWQNAAWVVECRPDQVAVLRDAVRELRREYRQDSAAWTEGETVFI